MTTPTHVIRSGVYKNVYKTGETHTIFGTYDSWSGAKPTGIIWAHGSGENALTPFQFTEEFALIQGLAKMGTVATADFSLQAWGNDDAIDGIDKMIDHLVAVYGVVAPVVLVGASMGGCNVLNYLRAHPSRVRTVAGIIPLCDINSIYPAVPGDIDLAYPPTGWSEATFGAHHNPVTFASTLDGAIPVKLWYASDDPLIAPSTVELFTSLSPNTHAKNMGLGGHSQLSIAKATPEVLAWVKDNIS